MASLEQKYQKKTDKEHILDNPDTYIGSIENVEQPLYVFQDMHVDERNIAYNPGLFKLFDEGIVNCRDHVLHYMNHFGYYLQLLIVEVTQRFHLL